MAAPDGIPDEIRMIESQRSRFIYVPFQKLMDGVFADLHGSLPCNETYKIFHEKIENAQFLGFKVSMNIDCPSSLVPSRRIKLVSVGDCTYGNVEAEKECVRKMLAKIYDELKLFPADFSFIEIQSKRSLFNAMKNALEPTWINYHELYSHMHDIHEDLYSPCIKLSVWVGQSINLATPHELAAVSRFYVKFSQQLTMFQSEMNHCRRICSMLELKHVEPESMRLFEASVPIETAINWELSHYSLEAVFREAVKKLRGGLSKVESFNFGPGEVRAVLDVVGTPHHFSGDLAPTKKIACAKLYYKVIKYVQDHFGFCVMDFHFDACAYLKAYIATFDYNMSNLMKCAERLKLIFDELIGAFDDSVSELLERLEISESNGIVLENVHAAGVFLRGKKIEVDSKWNAIKGRQVDRASLEWQLAH